MRPNRASRQTDRKARSGGVILRAARATGDKGAPPAILPPQGRPRASAGGLRGSGVYGGWFLPCRLGGLQTFPGLKAAAGGLTKMSVRSRGPNSFSLVFSGMKLDPGAGLGGIDQGVEQGTESRQSEGMRSKTLLGAERLTNECRVSSGATTACFRTRVPRSGGPPDAA
ncbi:hypothetical protein ES703_59312 [subsurface metagenome]